MFWIKYFICKLSFSIFSRFSFFFFKPKPNLRVNAFNLKGIEWLLSLVGNFSKNLKEIQKTLLACSLMEVDIDKSVEFKISSKVKEKEESSSPKKSSENFFDEEKEKENNFEGERYSSGSTAERNDDSERESFNSDKDLSSEDF